MRNSYATRPKTSQRGGLRVGDHKKIEQKNRPLLLFRSITLASDRLVRLARAHGKVDLGPSKKMF